MENRRDSNPRDAARPFVSVIVPVFNEERDIVACLQSILFQDYPPDRTEIVVVDGMSTDRTVVLAERLAKTDPRIRIVQNPRRRQPFAMNIGIGASTGTIIVRVDGHSVIKSDHVSRSVEYLERTGADHIGGVCKATGRSYISSTIALALSSPFGVGSARFRYADREIEVEHVPFGAYRRDTLDRLGGFDESFLIGEDSELDFRIVLAGGSVRLTPNIVTEYFCRDSLRRLGRQFFTYGRCRTRMAHKHGGFATMRTLAPALTVSTVTILALASLFMPGARTALVGVVALYCLGILAASIRIASRGGWKYLLLLPATLMTLHWSHGIGFLSGLPIFFTPRPQAGRAKPVQDAA